MKLTEITITGMHKIDRKTYHINDNLTYFVGPNGAGKSTVLEAIQLALLGYVPGYAKTNEGVMKHASGPVLAVVAKTDSGATITRTWTRTGSSVTSSTNVEGYDGDLSSLVSEIELPIFNFNEFKSMTANSLKNWFISFLPNSADDVDLVKALEDEAAVSAIPYDELLARAVDKIKEIEDSGVTGVQVVQKLNEYFKAEKSFTDASVKKLTATIQSLVKYDDVENLDEAALSEDISKYEQLKAARIQWEGQKAYRDKAVHDLNMLKAALPASSFDKDDRIKPLEEEAASAEKQAQILAADYDDLSKAINALQAELANVPKAGSAVCPITKTKCETAEKFVTQFEAKRADLTKQIEFKREEAKDCNPIKVDELRRKAYNAKMQIQGIKAQYDRFASIESAIQDLPVEPTTMLSSEIEVKIRELRDKVVKIEANKHHDALVETVTADKFKLENDLRVINLWVKLTDANGLQSTMMNKPFENMADDMSKYLSIMFGSDTKAQFNLVSKANSFSFGIQRDGSYIEFDYLSSGERCLFTLAMILCILNRSKGAIRTIIVDDILDHLDNANADTLFKALKKVTDVQFILAGVKDCSIKEVCTTI